MPRGKISLTASPVGHLVHLPAITKGQLPQSLLVVFTAKFFLSNLLFKNV